jgi:hypothetical protein
LGRRVMFRPTRLSSISSERNTFNGAHFTLGVTSKPRGTRPVPPVDAATVALVLDPDMS